ncbi:MAG: DUF4339 domain-containing protein [Chthoniobacteraceae bacterium]
MSVYLLQGDRTTGPYPVGHVQALLASGKLGAEQMYWMEGMTGWEPLSSFGAAPRSQPNRGNSSATVPLTCASCGAKLQAPSDRRTVECSFCGSTNLINSPDAPAPQDRLRKFLEAGSVCYVLPIRHEVEDAKRIITLAVHQFKSGIEQPERLEMSVLGLFLPVWVHEAQIHCTWQGRYSQRQVVERKRPTGERYEETQTTWHPMGGVHDFSLPFHLRAVKSMANFQVGKLVSTGDINSADQDQPAPDPRMTMVYPDLGGHQSWRESNVENLARRAAAKECAALTEKLTSLSTTIGNRTTSLLYVPTASVTYSVGAQQYPSLRQFVQPKLLGRSSHGR